MTFEHELHESNYEWRNNKKKGTSKNTKKTKSIIGTSINDF